MDTFEEASQHMRYVGQVLHRRHKYKYKVSDKTKKYDKPYLEITDIDPTIRYIFIFYKNEDNFTFYEIKAIDINYKNIFDEVTLAYSIDEIDDYINNIIFKE